MADGTATTKTAPKPARKPAARRTTAARKPAAAAPPAGGSGLQRRVKALEDRVDALVTSLGGKLGVNVED